MLSTTVLYSTVAYTCNAFSVSREKERKLWNKFNRCGTQQDDNVQLRNKYDDDDDDVNSDEVSLDCSTEKKTKIVAFSGLYTVKKFDGVFRYFDAVRQLASETHTHTHTHTHITGGCIALAIASRGNKKLPRTWRYSAVYATCRNVGGNCVRTGVSSSHAPRVGLSALVFGQSNMHCLFVRRLLPLPLVMSVFNR